MKLLEKFLGSQSQAPSREQSLSARPVRHPQIEWDEDEGGVVTLRLPQPQGGARRAVATVLAAPPSRVVALDEIGSEIWRRCDGQQTVRDLIRFVMERYQFARKEADASVTSYLRTLGQRGLVAFAIPQAETF